MPSTEQPEGTPKKPHGFVTFIDSNGTPTLRFRAEDGGKLDTVLPFPDRNATSYIHPGSGSMIDLSVQTPIVERYATDDDLAKDAAPAGDNRPDPAGPRGQKTSPPVQST